jgi:hypothetical protein
MAWGTDVMMLGKVPAGGYPGSGGPIPAPVEAPYQPGPMWRTNFITNPVVSPSVPQNPMRVFNGGWGWPNGYGGPAGASAGQPIVNYPGSNLSGGLRGLGRTLVSPVNPGKAFTMGLGGIHHGPAWGAEPATISPGDAMANPAVIEPCVTGWRYGDQFISRAEIDATQNRMRFWALHMLGATVGATHGYYRNKKSLGWTATWGAFGFFLPVLTVATALFQGLGQAKRRG